MSTDFLNRRMDLIHTNPSPIGALGPGPGGGETVYFDTFNKLKMDTSYPVKLAGKVIKIFTADGTYSPSEWKIANSEDEIILEVDAENVYDFAGNALTNDNIGEDKTYESYSEVFKKDDYVMVIIDFEAQTLHLCSETNFQSYFLNKGKGNVKLFPIDGNDAEFEIDGDIYNIGTKAINESVAFEDDSKETHSLMRHSKDNVMWELPRNEDYYDETGHFIGKAFAMTPVARVNNFNINCLNASISSLVFPGINMTNTTRGLDNIQGFNCYYKIEGQVNENFIEKYCFTYDEINPNSQNHIDLFTKVGNVGWYRYGLRFVDTIDQADKDKYYYVLVDGIDVDNTTFSTGIVNQGFWVLPINKETYKFCAYLLKEYIGAYVNSKLVTLKAMDGLARFLSGAYWEGDNFNGFYQKHYKGHMNNTAGSLIGIVDNGVDKVDMSYGQLNKGEYIYRSYNHSNRSPLSNSTLVFGHLKATDEQIMDVYDHDVMDQDDPESGARANESYNKLKYVKRFINFFGNEDEKYKLEFYRYMLQTPNNDDPDNINVFRRVDDDEEAVINMFNINRKRCPIVSIVINPGQFEHLLYGENPDAYDPKEQDHEQNVREACNIHNFCSITDSRVTTPEEGFKRTDFKLENTNIWGGVNYQRVLPIIYELFDRLDPDNFKFEFKDQFKSDTEGNCSCKINNVTAPFVCHVNKSPIDTGETNIIASNLVHSNNENHIYNIINLVSLQCINDPYIDDDTSQYAYNDAELNHMSVLVDHKIEFAFSYDASDLHIFFDVSDNISIKPDFGDATTYDLYTIVGTENNNFSVVRLNLNDNFVSTSKVHGLNYFYYVNNNSEVHRIKYFYSTRDINNESLGKKQKHKYDYYVDSHIMTLESITSSADLTEPKYRFARAYVNAYIAENKTESSVIANLKEEALNSYNTYIANSNWQSIITYIIKHYKFFPYNLGENDNRMVSRNFGYGYTDTMELTSTFDYSIRYAISPNERTLNNGKGAKLKDFIKEDAVHENCLAPYVSNTKVNGSLVYNVASFVKYLKHTKVSDVFRPITFKYLNGTGIRDEYYIDENNNSKTLYEFYSYCLSRNMHIPSNNPKSIKNDKSLSSGLAIYSREDILKVNKVEPNNDYKLYTKDSNDAYIPYTLISDLIFRIKVDPSSPFGFHPITVYNGKYDVDNGGDKIVNSLYESEDVMWISKIQTGDYTVYDISINDGKPTTSDILNINGILGSYSVDDITWNTILLSLNNNKTIDLLSTSLKEIKTQINDKIVYTTQNINSRVTNEQQTETNSNARKHDTIFDDPDNPEPSPRPGYENIWKATNANVDETSYVDKYDLCKFNFGYGFGDTWVNNTKTREINNRGVIVFETEGFKTIQYRTNQTGEEPKDYTYKTIEGSIYPKRMYINSDGIVCTKEFAESHQTISALITRIENLEAALGIQNSNSNNNG